ncbi:hypothetical protein V493_07998 [Pseudogymnoascus sp. VKM F-4281 (FW-2241)]|nr:hypothetical protein V493_07998 [Pseudogymnoascus sp. VKM F-4281 (FW-2241)]
MSQVVPQVDVGVLTLNGLAAFTPVLAALSADDVTPLAMVQMENLGSLFHINGKYALQVPDLLQRCKSTRLDRLGLLIGWRKGDAASLMAQSAGGQAISLLSMCILNLYEDADTGRLLSGLSKIMLPQTIAIASPSHLVRVARTLSSKLQVLGFGNILASQIVRIYDAYKHFGKSVPNNFLDKITTDNMAELLHALTRAVREESIVVRITGSRSMGHILAIVTIMFPEDAFVTMDNVVVFEGLRKSILVEFTDSDGILNVQIESKLQIQSTVPILPLRKRDRSAVVSVGLYCYSYNWLGCMADMLQVMFMRDGLISSEPLRIACCDMLEPLSKALGSDGRGFDRTAVLRNHGFIRLLGPYPHERIDQVCQKVWRIPPGWARRQSSLKSAFDGLVLAFAEATPTVSCTCSQGPDRQCLTENGWLKYFDESKMRSCPLYRLWEAVGFAIGCGISCLFINAGDGATIRHPMVKSRNASVADLVSHAIDPKQDSRKSADDDRWSSDEEYWNIYSSILRFCDSEPSVAASSTSSTLYLTALQAPQLPNTLNALFILLEGQLIFNGRYHTSLEAMGCGRRPEAKNIHQDTQPIIPSSVGEHSSLMMTILEGVHSLELTSTILIGGRIVHLHLQQIIIASWGVHEAEPCEHPANSPLDPRHAHKVLTTSVASPTAAYRIAIVQVSQNPVAQLLACVSRRRLLLQTNCCLNCAYKVATKERFQMIIVA